MRTHIGADVDGQALNLHSLQVTFHLSKDNIFTAEAVDLNTGRHHLWQVGTQAAPDILTFCAARGWGACESSTRVTGVRHSE